MTLLIPLGGSLREIEISISLTLSTVIYRDVQNKQKWKNTQHQHPYKQKGNKKDNNNDNTNNIHNDITNSLLVRVMKIKIII